MFRLDVGALRDAGDIARDSWGSDTDTRREQIVLAAALFRARMEAGAAGIMAALKDMPVAERGR